MAFIRLYEDLWSEILHRLSIQTLCRIRCVCKSWNSLISSSSFISHHFSSSNSNQSHILFNIYNNNSWFYAYAYLTHPRVDLSQLQLLRIPFQPTHNSPKDVVLPSDRVFDVIGVVNGVVCLFHYSKRFTILWNPTIHKYVEIPPSSSSSLSGRVAYDIGFGFDTRNNDFKIVRFWPPSSPDRPRFEVFSTRQGLWREVPAILLNDLDKFSFVSDVNCYKDGFIHWVVRRSLVMEILVFDCEREEFKMMDLPREFRDYSGSVGVFITQGELSVFGRMGSKCEVMNMDDGGVWKMTEPHKYVTFNRIGTHFPQMLQPMLIEGYKNITNVMKVFEPSMFLMFLMDAESRAMSYNVKEDGDGKVYFVKDGKRYDECLPIWRDFSFDDVALRSAPTQNVDGDATIS